MRIWILGMLFLVLVGCHTTKYVLENKYLITRNTFKDKPQNFTNYTLRSFVAQQTNTKTFGFLPLKLSAYSLSSINGRPSFLRKIGEPPVIFDSNTISLSISNLTKYLQNSGYMDGTVSVSVKKRKKKAKVIYQLDAKKQYLIDSISYDIPKDFESVVKQTLASTRKQPLNLYQLEEKRSTIAEQIRNEGYFFFNQEYISFLIDTNQTNKTGNIRLSIKPKKENDSLFIIATTPTKIKQVVILENIPLESNIAMDSLLYKGYLFLYPKGSSVLKAKRIIQSSLLITDELLKPATLNRTYFNLYALQMFKQVTISTDEYEIRDGAIYVTPNISLNTLKIQSWDKSIGGSLSSGQFGYEGGLGYTHKNLFKGAEKLYVTGNYTSIGGRNGEQTKFDATLGIESPTLITPFKNKSIWQNSAPKTDIALNFSWQTQAEYERRIIGVVFGYLWQPNRFQSHRLKLINFNVVDMLRVDDNFVQSIGANEFVKYSFQTHINPSTAYSFIFTTRGNHTTRKYFTVNTNLILAGNSFTLFNQLINSSLKENDIGEQYYEVLGIRYSQYISGELSYAHGVPLSKSLFIAYRLGGGLQYAYGNSLEVPFENRFFMGGANGLRAWNPYSIGPSRAQRDRNTFPSQTGNVKVISSVELRSQLFWLLEGALFIDAGNVWNLKGENSFKISEFYNELAIGTGIGIRLISPLAIFRLDIGFQTLDPSSPANERFVWNNHLPFSSAITTYNIAIDYPF